jgi:hypothetical protein
MVSPHCQSSGIAPICGTQLIPQHFRHPTPAILAIPIARAVRRHRDAQVRGACAAIVIASCVLMATTSVRLAPEAAPSLRFALLGGSGFIPLASRRVPPVVVILASACLGPLLPS